MSDHELIVVRATARVARAGMANLLFPIGLVCSVVIVLGIRDVSGILFVGIAAAAVFAVLVARHYTKAVGRVLVSTSALSLLCPLSQITIPFSEIDSVTLSVMPLFRMVTIRIRTKGRSWWSTYHFIEEATNWGSLSETVAKLEVVLRSAGLTVRVA